jgi:Arylsulfotransferase (ASST)
VQRFRSQPDLAPVAVTVTRSRGASSDDAIFLAPQQGPVQSGPVILDQNGQLIWFKPLPDKNQAADFRVQSYRGKPVLTWWQGYLGAGVGSGENVIVDTSYRQVATVRAANGLSADLHEFELTPRGTALITAYYLVYWDASSVGGATRQIVMDSVVQEIDVKTGLVLFQWDSIDHVPLSDAHTKTPAQAGSPLDYFHVNSVAQDRDGNLVISARNTSAAYKVDRQTGKLIWTLGGKRSSFTMGPGTWFAFQHDVRVRSANDRVMTLFDNGGGPPRASEHSRGLTLTLDLKRMTATRVAEYRHAPPLPANYEGNLQQLPGGDAYIGWGQQPYFAQFDSRGQPVLDGRFVSSTANYRAYMMPWKATPITPPAVSAEKRGAETVVHASWNGATDVASWRVLTGDGTTSLAPVATHQKGVSRRRSRSAAPRNTSPSRPWAGMAACSAHRRPCQRAEAANCSRRSQGSCAAPSVGGPRGAGAGRPCVTSRVLRTAGHLASACLGAEIARVWQPVGHQTAATRRGRAAGRTTAVTEGQMGTFTHTPLAAPV